MDELLAAAAEVMEIPVDMVERSAEARAKADGVSIEDVLRAWSGGGEIVATVPAAEVAEAAPSAEPEPAVTPEPPAATADAGPVDEGSLVALAAEKLGMPESMVRRSAAARAKAEGGDATAIIMEWAGVDASTVPDSTAGTAPTAPTSDAPPPAAETPVTPAAPAAAPGSMDEAAILAAAAEKMGMPETMVKRSAGARAKAQGVDVSVVLAEWAGVGAPAQATAGSAAPAEPESASAPAAPAAPAVASAPVAATPEIEVLGEPDEPPAIEESAEAESLEPEEEAVAAGALPRWLAALFVLIPAFAVAYALFLPNGPNCGDAGSLAVDPVTGLAVNCDGTQFGSQVLDLFALGSEVYNSAGCTACHGPTGDGVASFPAFTGGALLATFPEGSCSVQQEWVSLGTTGWPDATYGVSEKPVGGSGAVMPGFQATLTAEEITAVAVYERVAFGGEDLDAALADCGGTVGEPAAAVGE